jgi:hypothetical protein
MPFAASLPVRLGITLVYPAVLLLGGFLSREERQTIARRLRR